MPRQPFSTATVSWPFSHSRRQTARITALRPGQSPPPVSTPTRTAVTLHSLGSVYADKLQATRDHRLCRAAQRESQRFLLGSEHAALVVEAMEVVGDLDRVRGNR